MSSDIWLVRASGGARAFCVKQALPRLRVAAEWLADPARNSTEVKWLRHVAGVDSQIVPALLASDPQLGVFAMEYLPPSDYETWKAQARSRRRSHRDRGSRGKTARGHPLVVCQVRLRGGGFCHRSVDFHALRLEPYGWRPHACMPTLQRLSRRSLRARRRTKTSVVHGDISPKNILLGQRGPVFLYAECAWFGDPAFDLAFCLNHLLLKTLLGSIPSEADLLEAFDTLAGQHLRWREVGPVFAIWKTWSAGGVAAARASTGAASTGNHRSRTRPTRGAKNTVRRIAKPLLKDAPSDLTRSLGRRA